MGKLDDIVERVVVIDRHTDDDRVRAILDRRAPELERSLRRAAGHVDDLQLHPRDRRRVLIRPELQRIALRGPARTACSREIEQGSDVQCARIVSRFWSRGDRRVRRAASAKKEDERDDRPRARRASHPEAGCLPHRHAPPRLRGAGRARSRPERSPFQSRRPARFALLRGPAR